MVSPLNQKMGDDSSDNNSDSSKGKNKKTNSKNNVSNRDLMDTLLSMKREATETNNKWNQYTTQNDEKISTIEKQAAATNKQLDELSNQIGSLHASQQAIFEQQEKWKQQQLQNNITIMGIPSFDSEDLFGYIVDICDKLELIISENEIESINRVIGSKNHIIIVRFHNFNTKMAIVQKTKHTDLFTSDVFANVSKGSTEDKQIYINHHLTPHFAKLLQFGKDEKKNGSLHSCWIGSSGLLVKCTENDAPRSFSSLDALRAYIRVDQQLDSNIESRNKSNPPKRFKNTNSSQRLNNAKTTRARHNSRTRSNNKGQSNGNTQQNQNNRSNSNNRANGNGNNGNIVKPKRKQDDISLNSSSESATQQKSKQLKK